MINLIGVLINWWTK